MKTLLLTLLLLIPATALAGDATLYRGEVQVRPTCPELQAQVKFLASVMVASQNAGHELGCVDQRDSACYAHAYTYMKAADLGEHMARMFNEQCRSL